MFLGDYKVFKIVLDKTAKSLPRSVQLDDFLPPIVASASDICLPLDLPSLANTVPFNLILKAINYYRAFQRLNTLPLYSEPISLRHLKFL